VRECVKGQGARGKVEEDGGRTGREGGPACSSAFFVASLRKQEEKGRSACLSRALASANRPPLGAAHCLAARHHPLVPARSRSNALSCLSHIPGGIQKTKEEGHGRLALTTPAPQQTTRIHTLYYKHKNTRVCTYPRSDMLSCLVPCYCRCVKPSSKARVPPPR
jgi:hypothetical protein